MSSGSVSDGCSGAQGEDLPGMFRPTFGVEDDLLAVLLRLVVAHAGIPRLAVHLLERGSVVGECAEERGATCAGSAKNQQLSTPVRNGLTQ